MTGNDLSLLLAVLGATAVLTAWVGRRTGDAARDVRLMAGVGGCLLAAGAAFQLA